MKKIPEYEQKYDFINKALLENVAQITEMTKPDHSATQIHNMNNRIKP